MTDVTLGAVDAGPDSNGPGADRPNALPSRYATVGRTVAGKFAQLVVLLFAVSTLMFFLLRITGDPALTLAGENATPEQIAAIRAQYGLDDSLLVQYFRFLGQVAQLDFGESINTGENALDLVLDRVPKTLQLAVMAVIVNTLVAVPLGAWIGSRPNGRAQAVIGNVVFIGQGIPGYVVALVLIQLFSVRWQLLPSFGSEGWKTYILPTLSLAAFLVPRLTRVLSGNVSEAMEQDFVRTARAFGARHRTVVRRHALPNALLGASALIGTQFAYLLSGALITEVIFAWPGLGQLMIQSVEQLDFPVVQASVFVVAVLVFLTNTFTDVMLGVIDPRLRRKR